MKKKVPGFIRDVRFKNISLPGRPGAYGVKLASADPEHAVRDVTLENVSISSPNNCSALLDPQPRKRRNPPE